MKARVLVTLLIAGLAAACEEAPKPIAPVATSGELVVLTVNGPATYFEDEQGMPSGREFDLVTCANGSTGAGILCPGSTIATIQKPFAEIDYKTSGGHDSVCSSTTFWPV